MGIIYNVYCDESCHLENDRQKVMVLGGVWCPEDKRQEIAVRIREIKIKHALKKDFEIKWTKVSPSKIGFYLDILDYFFDDDDLHFRGLIIPDKAKLKHDELLQDHDTWYYKMYFDMLKTIFSPSDKYKVYLDIKDTRGGGKIKKLHEVLCKSFYDFSCAIISSVQLVRSHEIEQLQLADLLIGIVMSVNRGEVYSEAKQKLIDRMKQRTGYCLTKTTLYKENKVNLLRWQAREF
jgi:hypothetical protein